MQAWVVYALLSMVFAGVTAVIAKQGLVGISGEMGIVVRSVFLFAFTMIFALVAVDLSEASKLTRSNLAWLAASAATTTISWICYYKALAAGNVSTIAIIDKGSFIVAVLLAWLWLGERITPRLALGMLFVCVGLWIVVQKPAT